MKFETAAIHAGTRPDPGHGALSVPIYQTSTFAFSDLGQTKGYDYSRTANPTRRVLEETLAELEGGKAAFAFATGMAAETTVAHLLKSGDHVLCSQDVYAGTYRLFEKVMRQLGVDVTFIKISDRSVLEGAIKPNTRMIWIETPSNPLLNITDLEMVSSVAKKHGIMTTMDNTFATPYFLRPIKYGFDLVVHSTTKYLNGHSDVVGGAVVTTTDELTENIQFLLNTMGTCAGPFDCWLVLRGIETLALRMKQHETNAEQIADYLANHQAVSRVFFPGLKTHPGHEIASRQMTGFGGMVSFEARGGPVASRSFLKSLKLFSLAESLGGAASLAEHPATMSHASMGPEFRASVGINDSLVRLSIGLESADDLIADLAQALEAPA